MAGRLWSIELYSRIIKILQELGGQGSMMRFSDADYDSSSLGERLDWILEGHGMAAGEKARLFSLLWDMTSDGFAGRTHLFEMLTAFLVFHLKDFVVRSYDASSAIADIRGLLGIEKPA